MQLANFLSKIHTVKGNYGKVVSVASYYDKEIIINDKEEYFVDGIKLEQKFENLEEVKSYIDIQEEAFKTKVELYENISDTKVASIIRKEMRMTNKLDSEISGKIVFRLDDGKQVALSEQTLEKIANLLNNMEIKDQTIDFMRKSQENFLSVIRIV